MRKILVGAMAALLLIVSLAPAAFAQDANRLSQLKISIWPEYDTPTVLVLLDGTLADKTNLPRSVSLLIPSNANLTVTTWENADGSLAPEQPNQSVDAGDGFTRVTFTINQPNYHVEYYHDLLKGAPDKSMDWQFKSATPVDQVLLEVQQPLKATNFVLTPTTSTTRTDASGFKYYSYQFANVTTGQVLTTQAKYTKSDPNPSFQAPPSSQLPSSSASAPTTTSTASSSNDNLLLLAGLVGLGLIVILGIFVYQQRSRAVEELTANKMSPRQFQRQRRRARGTEGATVFCTKCGNPLGPDDNFCPKCGAQRRVV
ncbi:MAG: zinc ribbon domain-containing protein [Chloroflexi bacterium]|nr:zinc ribbon domain-containing protein [Chloroflexota bacterium]